MSQTSKPTSSADAGRNPETTMASRLDAVLDMLRSLGESEGLDDLLEKLLRQITQFMRADRASIFLLDAESETTATQVTSDPVPNG